MSWHDVLFMHWPVPEASLAPHIPKGLTLQTFEGEAWLGVVPFRMTGVKPRFFPDIPRVSAFLEMNVRTYVTSDRDGKPGVWFISLDAASRLAVRFARLSFHLPYFDARMSLERTPDGIRYRSERVHRGAVGARFEATYRGAGPVRTASEGSLEHWLTERYCLYAADARGRLYRGDIHHIPWPLQDGEATVETLDMTRLLDMALPDTPPLLHFADRLDVVAWPPVALR